MVLKEYTVEREKFSEEFGKHLTYVDVEEKTDYNDKTKIMYHVTVMCKSAKSTLDVVCEEPLPRELEYGSKIDFEKAKITYKGKGRSSYGTVITADLLVTSTAKKCIIVK